MKRFAFISALLIAGLFSLQMQLKYQSRSFYEHERVVEKIPVEEIKSQIPFELDDHHYLYIDSTGQVQLLKKKRLISL